MNADNLKVLIVEDEAPVAAGLSSCLHILHYQTLGIVSTGREAIQFVEHEQPGLILMDINLPEVDGITTMSIINEKHKIPCIFITGYSDETTVARAQTPYTFGYIIKPVDVGDLRAAINTAVARYNDYISVNTSLHQTKKALEDRKVIERAKGILMDMFDMREAQAMQYLQKKSRDTNTKLIDLARKIIEINGKGYTENGE